MHRRAFLNRTSAAAAGLVILPSGALAGATAPSNRLNLAIIGAYGRAYRLYDIIANHNVAAVCDIREDHIAKALERFPGAKTYVDWRKCLNQRDLDAVIIFTTDQTHAMIANWAMNRGLHVYCEKPIAISVGEARALREKFRVNRGRIATQAGTQLNTNANFNRVREMIHDGAIGDLQEVRAWGTRQIPRDGYLPAKGSPPAGLHYDLWLGPAPDHPYNPGYFSAERPGSNCLNWNMFWDFGAGQAGDMGSHTMDLAWKVIDATLPTRITARGEAFNPEVTPVELEAHFHHPANDWRDEIRVSWYQGGAMPRSPRPYIDLSKVYHGCMFRGSRGFLIADFDTRTLIPFGDDADMTHYTPRPESQITPPERNIMLQWFDACKDPTLATNCNFEYGSHMIEQQLLGLVAYRAGGDIEYDPAAGRVTNNDEANALIHRQYREGWVLDG